MRGKIFLIIITVSIILAGCGKSIPTNAVQQEGQTTSVAATTNSADTKSKGTTTPSNSKTENNQNYLVLEAYKAVLQNKVNFFSQDNKKNVYLNDFLTNEEIYGTIFKVTRFAVLDLDGDKTPEVVLELSVGNNDPMCFEVLHYVNGAVYGCNIVYRGLEELKADGTFMYSNGASDYGCGKLRFKSNACETDILGYCKSSESNNGITISYFINNKSVTEKSFNSFIQEEHEKKGATFYEFSQKNIESMTKY